MDRDASLAMTRPMSIISSFSENQSEFNFENSAVSMQANPTIADQASEDEQSCIANLRPKTFQDYVGQTKLKEILQISISAAKKRNDPASVGHILLYGPPGLGKTSCASLLAGELGTKAHIFSAPALERPKDILGTLMSVQTGDVIFIDEIHRFNKITEELLYPALEDFQIDLSTGKGTSSRVMRLNINKFIMVGATTKLGCISSPLRDRFIHLHRMEYYSENELAEILKHNSQKLNIELQDQAAAIIAASSRGTPRITNRLLRLVRDYAHHLGHDHIDLEIAEKALKLYRIDNAGLDLMDRKILSVLVEKYNGGPAGLEAIASIIGEDKDTIEDYYEPFLIQSGYLIRTQRGRIVTEKGFEYLKK